jgi:hypothetical protein
MDELPSVSVVRAALPPEQGTLTSSGCREYFAADIAFVFVIVLAALLLGEALSWKSAIGALLMIAGAIIISV